MTDAQTPEERARETLGRHAYDIHRESDPVMSRDSFPEWEELSAEKQRRWCLIADQVRIAATLPRLASERPATSDHALRDALDALMVHDPNWVCAGVPDDAVEAGIIAWDAAKKDLEDENYIPAETADWDEGMIVCAIFKAVLRAALNNGGEA
jgi:hypothetical protein